MVKICTTIEQSKKLLELGVDVNIADMTYVSMKDYGENTYHLTVGKTDIDWAKDELGNLNWNDVYEKYIPAWSLSALLELMPERIKIGDELSFCLTSKKSLTGFSFGYNLNGSTFVKDNPLDAAFEMVCWLKENNKI